MKSIKIEPAKKINGTLRLPGDKSISHRAIMIGAISRGRTIATNVLDCDDCNHTISAFRQMGVSIKKYGSKVIISGRGLRGLRKPKGPLWVGESGTTMRLLSGILSGQDFEVRLEGDTSLSNRPMMRIVEPLSEMGVDIRASTGGYPPLAICGGSVHPVNYRMPIPSAQVKSAVLFAALYADGRTSIEEAFKSRDHTERMLKFFGAKIRTIGLKISLDGGRELRGRSVCVPADISSASFFMVAAALLKNSKIIIEKVSINPTRMGVINIMRRMGVRIKVVDGTDAFEPVGDIEVETSQTRGTVISEGEIPAMIDELPIIFVLASLSKGKTVIRGAEELRVKETDRIKSMKTNLEKMGAEIDLKGKDIIITGCASLKGSRSLRSFGDHRTCMATSVASLTAENPSEIHDIACVNKSLPEFFKYLKYLENKRR